MNIRMFTLPNMLTLCNLLCGLAAIAACFLLNDLVAVFWLVIAAAAFDFLDGFAARLTKSYSELGKQLDSLSDMVSFGVVPSAVLFLLYLDSAGRYTSIYYAIIPASVALFSALRLAKFNIDENQSSQFIGLPTPACALFVVSVGWLYEKGELVLNPIMILVASVLLSYLLISPLRLFALKFKNWSWKSNKVRYVFILVSTVALIIWHITAIPFIIIAYILTSAVLAALCKGDGKATSDDMNKID